MQHPVSLLAKQTALLVGVALTVEATGLAVIVTPTAISMVTAALMY